MIAFLKLALVYSNLYSKFSESKTKSTSWYSFLSHPLPPEEPVEDVAEKSTNKDGASVVDEPPTRENDTNIEDFDGSIALRSQAPKSVAGTRS